MALAVSLRIDFIDSKKKASFTKIRLPTGRTLADYKDFGEQICQLFLNAGTGRITNASVCFGVDLSGAGLSTNASSVSKVTRKGNFRFFTASSGFLAKVRVPSIAESKVVSGSDDLDQGDADVIAYVDDLVNGVTVTGGTMTFTNGRGHDITALKAVKERFQRRSAK